MTTRDSVPGTVGALTEAQFASRLVSGLALRLGPFNVRIAATPDQLVAPLHELYRDYRLLAEPNVFHFHARLDTRRNFPRIDRRLVRFSVDGKVPHEDMPADQALPVLEWGLNLVIALRAHNFVMLHAAAVALDGKGVLLPAAPGSGKTTLSAGLALSGWQLLSDEFGLLRPGSTQLVPIPRPLALKNDSIDVVREFSSEAYIGPRTDNTRKGTVAHLRPPSASVAASEQPVDLQFVVFPRWVSGSECVVSELSENDAFMLLATNAFNYELLGEKAFTTVAEVVEKTRCFDLVYSDLEVAIPALRDIIG